MSSAYTIYDSFDFPAFCIYAAHHSGSDFKHVYTKPQLRYLDNYLSSSEIAVNSVICEHQYVERHYLEDYSEYFVRCFYDYGRKASRVHFFSINIEESDFESLLNGTIKDPDGFVKELQDSYLGFVVIRPIPNTLIAHACLKPYKSLLENDDDNKLIYKDCKANLFGIELTVSSLPFLEQDRVVAACATASLWSFLNAPVFSFRHIPSPSSITKRSFITTNTKYTHFPKDGLNAEKMSRIITSMGLSPYSISLEPNSDNGGDNNYLSEDLSPELKSANNISWLLHTMTENIYSHLSAGLPGILGMDVYEQTKNGAYAFIGRHAVTVAGFSLSDKPNLPPLILDEIPEIELMSSRIKCLYVHDDQIGPYARAEIVNKKILLTTPINSDNADTLENPDNGETRKQIEVDWYIDIPIDNDDTRNNFKKRIYLPDLLQLGMNQKIRISLPRIKKTCGSFNERVKEVLELEEKAKASLNLDEDCNTNVCDIPDHGFTWDIRLSTVNNYKQNLFNNGAVVGSKSMFLSKSLPKYLWVASASNNNSKLFDFVFDATDIEQGNVFLETIYYDKNYKEIFADEILTRYFKNQLSKPVSESPLYALDNNVLSIVKELINDNECYYSYLDGKYGYPRPPAYFKPWEMENDGPRLQLNVRTFREPRTAIPLDTTIKYIWAIDREGYLHVGEDILVGIHEGKPAYIGHPTLTDNMWARIAGELKYCETNKHWVVNAGSGRFCKKNAGITARHLENATSLFNSYLHEHKPFVASKGLFEFEIINGVYLFTG